MDVQSGVIDLDIKAGGGRSGSLTHIICDCTGIGDIQLFQIAGHHVEAGRALSLELAPELTAGACDQRLQGKVTASRRLLPWASLSDRAGGSASTSGHSMPTSGSFQIKV